MKTFVRALLALAGVELRRSRPLAYGSASDFRRALKIVRPYTMLPEGRLRSLYEQVSYCEAVGIEGALVECGVWKGGAVGMMALASAGNRQLHLFDSFTDICEPDARDGDRAAAEAGPGNADGRLRPIPGFYDAAGGHGTVAICRDLLARRIGYDPGLLHFHAGWFQETIPLAETGPIAILRLDGDWYASTKAALDCLFDRVVPGGFVIIDDYGAYDGCASATDEFFQSRGIRPFLCAIDFEARYFQKSADQVPVHHSGRAAIAGSDGEAASRLRAPAEGLVRIAA